MYFCVIHNIFYIINVNNLERCASLYYDEDYKDLIQHVGVTEVKSLIYNDVVSSVKVTPGCTLIGYNDRDFYGWMFTTKSNIHWLGSNNDKMSSFQCYCSKYGHSYSKSSGHFE